MEKFGFDKYASEYDRWFMENINVLHSELKIVAHFLDTSSKILSVGCGSGLFENLLQQEYGINIKNGIEPSQAMAEIARKRGIDVKEGTAEEADFGEGYDIVIFNGTPSYITDLEKAVKKAYDALNEGGKIILIDVPKESAYGMMYNLAYELKSWEHPLVKDVCPPDPYPIEFLELANWRTTKEKIEIIEKTGFKNLEFVQTLTTLPLFSNNKVEEPIEGYDKGSYVAVCAIK